MYRKTRDDPVSDGNQRLRGQSPAVANILGTLGNERRLVILCKLVETGEMTVGALVEAVGLSQSALSQHLAKMRDDDIVSFRRNGQTLWYRVADPRIAQLIAELHRLFCRAMPAT